jgi:predicted 2-oxoglutarate/Fe(II)-dependent dioxygenase YbiX
MVELLDGPKLFVIREFLSPQECDGFIERSEQLGFADAPITSSAGFLIRKDIRDNARVVLDTPSLAAEWWERAKPLLVEDWLGWKVAGLNERFRFYRYDIGQRFAPHTDGYFERANGERSHFTFMVYLNDGFEGGATAFHHSKPSLRVTPERGMALVFYHRQLHEGMPILKGRKYVLRTDVMYRRVQDSEPGEQP